MHKNIQGAPEPGAPWMFLCINRAIPAPMAPTRHTATLVGFMAVISFSS